MFGYKQRSQVFCESCGHQSNTYSEHYTLQLFIPPTRKAQLSLQDCLNHFKQVEPLTGKNKYLCSQCKTKVNAIKSTSIETPPCILVIDFMRYTAFTLRKNSEIITYPTKFNLKDYMSRTRDE